MLTEVNNHWRQFVCCWLTRLNIQKISSCFEEITSVHQSIEFMDFTMNVRIHLNQANVDTILDYGKHSQIVSTVFQLLQLSMRK